MLKKLPIILLTLCLLGSCSNKKKEVVEALTFSKHEEEIKELIINSHIFDEYMEVVGVVKDKPYFSRTSSTLIEVQAGYANTPTLILNIKDNQIDITTIYHTNIYIPYFKQGRQVTGEFIYYRSKDTSQTLLNAASTTFQLIYHEDENLFYNPETGNDYDFLDNLEKKWLNAINIMMLLYNQMLMNMDSLVKDIELILKEEEPINKYDIQSVGLCDYVKELSEE